MAALWAASCSAKRRSPPWGSCASSWWKRGSAARACGYQRLILWTASPLVDAIRLYQKYGFHKTEQQPNTTWSLDGETVMEEKFELAL